MSNYGFHTIKLYPNVKYKYLAASATRLKKCEIDNINSINRVLSWSDIPGAFLLVNYGTEINSKTPDNYINNLVGWRIYRQKASENTLQFVSETGELACGIEDYMCANQTPYTYYVYPIINNGISQSIGQPIKTDKVKTDWWNYGLIGFKKGEYGNYEPYATWLFDCNLTSTQIVQNLDITKFSTFLKTPKISKGKSNYQTMGVTALLGGISYKSNRYEENMDLLETWQDFVGECDLCIWKDRKGSIKIGTIFENPSAQYIDVISEQPTQISFMFIETDNINNFQIFKYIEPYHSSIPDSGTKPLPPHGSGGDNNPMHNKI